MEELEGKGQAAYSEGITDTYSLVSSFGQEGSKQGGTLLVYCRWEDTRGRGKSR